MSAVCARWNAVLSAVVRGVAVFAALLPSQTVEKGLTRNFWTRLGRELLNGFMRVCRAIFVFTNVVVAFAKILWVNVFVFTIITQINLVKA
jgi:hypothetical protein